MSRSAHSRRNVILSGRQISGVVLAALGLAYLLIPRDTELVERLVEDGHHDRARELVVISGSIASGGAAVAGDASAEDLIAMLLQNQSGDIPAGKASQIATLIEITNDADATRRILDSHASRFTDSSMAECLSALAQRAVQLGEPGLGADFYDQMWQLQTPDEDQLRDIIATQRYAGDPKAALDCISRYLSELGQPFHRLAEDLRMTTVSLHREINDGSGAFDLLSEEYFASVDDDTRHTLMDLMTETAAQSERLEDCLPILEEYVATLNAASRTWQELRTQKQAHPGDADFRKYAFVLARHHEWNKQTEQAFEIYCKLAAMGDLDALDRCITIYPWVAKQDEATELLTALAPIPGRPQYTMLTARLEADRGSLEQAIALMEPVLFRHPEAQAVDGASTLIETAGDWLEFAQILEAAGHYEKAITAYRKTLSLEPQNHAPLQPVASLLVATGRNREALDALSQLSLEDHELHSLENYVMLASALGDVETEQRALEMRIAKNTTQPRASDFQDLSEFWQREGAFEKAIDVSRLGVAALPQSKLLQFNLIDQLIEAKQFNAAREEISRYDDPGDHRFTARLLQIANEVSDPLLVLQMIRRRPSDPTLSPGQRLELAALYESGELPESALKLYRSTRGGESGSLRLEAHLAYQRGDFAAALSHQRRYLDSSAEPDYEGWMFLGDILTASGDSGAARRAYQYALTVLRSHLNDPAPAKDTAAESANPLSADLSTGQSKAG